MGLIQNFQGLAKGVHGMLDRASGIPLEPPYHTTAQGEGTHRAPDVNTHHKRIIIKREDVDLYQEVAKEWREVKIPGVGAESAVEITNVRDITKETDPKAIMRHELAQILQREPTDDEIKQYVAVSLREDKTIAHDAPQLGLNRFIDAAQQIVKEIRTAQGEGTIALNEQVKHMIHEGINQKLGLPPATPEGMHSRPEQG